MNTPTGHTLEDAALAAAHAAMPLLPVAAPAVVAAASVTDVAPGHVGVAASFTGAESGQVLVLIDAEHARGVTADGTGDLGAALRPALAAAAESLGPCALAPVVTGSAHGLLEQAAGSSTVLASVRGDGRPAIYVVISRSVPVAVPPQRGTGPAAPRAQRGMDVLRGVQLEVTAEIGRTKMTVQELLSLTAGAVIELDRPVGSPADVLVNGQLFARGEVVVVDEDFAIRITEVVDPETGLA